MVVLTFAVDFQRLQDFHYGAGQRQGYADVMTGFNRIGQVFDMQVDLEAGLEVAGENHRRFGFHHRTASQAATDGVEHQFGVDAGFGSENQRFRQGGDVECHDDLIGQFRRVSSADIAAADHGFAHFRQQFDATVEDLLFAADHDRQRSIDCLRLTAADRRIQHFHPLLGDGGSDFLRRQRCDRAHVDQNQAGFGACQHAVLSQHRRLHMRRVRQHRDDRFRLGSDFFCIFRLHGACGHDFRHRFLVDIKYYQLVPGL